MDPKYNKPQNTDPQPEAPKVPQISVEPQPHNNPDEIKPKMEKQIRSGIKPNDPSLRNLEMQTRPEAPMPPHRLIQVSRIVKLIHLLQAI